MPPGDEQQLDKTRTMRRFIIALTTLAAFCTAKGQTAYTATTVDSDPMHTHIYTLSNGLTVYLSDNPEQPRIQTYIAVRAGGKNDPAESTGLAHYLEHLMFKGTSSFGTSNYAAERPILDQIEAQYEVYDHTTDPEQRKAIYHVIDSLSYAASRFAIANEYDKLMAGIGSSGSNAYTDVDVTCYTEDIPANEVERWARIQSDRFRDMVIRGFHTELEAVYEEYNIHLTNDFDKVDEAINAALYPHHPYGTQTVIGTQEHLKNPSLKNVKAYYHQWYVPNNVAICMSGDLSGRADSIVSIIDRYFGQQSGWMPNDHLHVLQFTAETPLSQPILKKTYGQEREMVVLAWRMPAIKERDFDKMEVVSALLSNGKAGLIDLDLVQSQKVMAAQVYPRGMADYSTLMLIGLPKEGQTLAEVSSLMLEEIEKLKSGAFPDEMLQAIVNNMKREDMQEMQSNARRANRMVQAYINRVEWQDQVQRIDRIAHLTKDDIVAFAKTYLGNGYVCCEKLQGEDPDAKKIDKPLISPIEMNRDKQSQFVSEVLAMPVRAISPVFVDFEKDMSLTTLKNGTKLLYKHNDDNGLFALQYVIERGTKQDKTLDLAASYLDYLGTDRLSADELQSELYRLACDADISVGESRTIISLSGLAENMPQAMALTEAWMAKAQPDDETLEALVEDIIKSRADDKLEQKSNFDQLVAYGVYGPERVANGVMSNEDMRAATSEQLLAAIRSLKDYQQTICYYGPASEKELQKLLRKHAMSRKPLPAETDNHYVALTVSEPEVIIAPYDAQNIYMRRYSNNGQVYDARQQASIDLFNEYFGGGMNTIVFQELREARGLAYSASAYYRTPDWKGDANQFYTNIITQNDKMPECIDVFEQITEDMPLSEGAFRLAKDAILKRLATERTTRGAVLFHYINLQDMGIDHDINRDLYRETLGMTIDDLARFQKENVRGRSYRTLILGNEKELDAQKLKSLGKITRVTTEDIFGY